MKMTRLQPSARGERVPLDLVMPHVQDWIDDWYGVYRGDSYSATKNPYITVEDVKRDHPEWGKHVNESLPVLVLASAAGLKPDTIGRWMRPREVQDGGTIGYFDADALFAGMDRIDLWSRDAELRAIRDELVARPDKEPRLCRCGCGATVDRDRRFKRGHNARKTVSSDTTATLPEDNDERTA